MSKRYERCTNNRGIGVAEKPLENWPRLLCEWMPGGVSELRQDTCARLAHSRLRTLSPNSTRLEDDGIRSSVQLANATPIATLVFGRGTIDCLSEQHHDLRRGKRPQSLAERLDQAVEMCALPSALSPLQIAKMAKQVGWREVVETGAGHGSTHFWVPGTTQQELANSCCKLPLATLKENYTDRCPPSAADRRVAWGGCRARRAGRLGCRARAGP